MAFYELPQISYKNTKDVLDRSFRFLGRAFSLLVCLRMEHQHSDE